MTWKNAFDVGPVSVHAHGAGHGDFDFGVIGKGQSASLTDNADGSVLTATVSSTGDISLTTTSANLVSWRASAQLAPAFAVGLIGRIEDASFAPLNTGGAALNGNIILGAKVQFSSLAPLATPNPLDFSLVDAGGYTGMGVAAYYWDLTWQAPQALPATINQYQSACWSPDLQTMVMLTGTTSGWGIATGRNGNDWSLQTFSGGVPYGVLWDSGPRKRFMIQGSSKFLVSADGVTWTDLRASPFYGGRAACYSPELDICTASAQPTGLYASYDGGTNWTAFTGQQAGYRYDSAIWCSGFGRFLFGGITSNQVAKTCTDDLALASINVQGTSSEAATFAYSAELNIVVASLASNNPGTVLQWSDDGLNFHNCTGMNNSSGYVLSWSPDLHMFCAVRAAYTYTSVDGKAWVAAGACGLISTIFGVWASGIGSFIYVNGGSPFSVVKSTPVV